MNHQDGGAKASIAYSNFLPRPLYSATYLQPLLLSGLHAIYYILHSPPCPYLVVTLYSLEPLGTFAVKPLVTCCTPQTRENAVTADSALCFPLTAPTQLFRQNFFLPFLSPSPPHQSIKSSIDQSSTMSKIEEITDAEAHDHSHTHANGEVHQHAHDEPASDNEEIPEGANVSIYSRAEKKARKLLIKLGLKKVEGISRVTLRRGNTHIFVIAQPEVFKNPASNSYIVFGECKIEDLSAAARAQAAMAASAEASGAAGQAEQAPKDQASITADLEAAAANVSLADDTPEEEVTEASLSAAGLSQDDLNLIKEQTGASDGKILSAFKANDKDVINTIVSLTS